MFVAPILMVLAAGQGAEPPVYFVRGDAIYRHAQGNDTLVVKDADAPAPSPDGKRLAFTRNGDLYVYELGRDVTRRCSHLADRTEPQPEHSLLPSWDPTSSYVVFSHADTYAVVRHGETAHPMYGAERSTRNIWNVYWCWTQKMGLSPDLSLFLGNETTGLAGFTVPSTSAAAFSPDGRRVAFCRDGDLWMATLDPSSIHSAIREASWDEARVLPCGIQEGGTRSSTETTTLFRISWSPDSKLLALSSDRYSGGGSPQIVVVKADNPTDKVGAFAGSDACFVDAGHIAYVKPYTKSVDIWLRDLDSHDERIFIARASEPAVGK